MRYLKAAIVLLFLLVSVILGGDERLRPTVAEPEPPISAAPEAEENAEPYDYDLSEYLTMGDISAVQADFDDPAVCTEKEVDAAVFQILLRNADFEEKNPKQRAERYNRVTVDLAVMQNGAVLPEYSQADYEIVIGLSTENGEDTVLGETLVGCVLGEVRTVDYTYPSEIGGGGLAGQSVVLSATVKKIEKQIIPELIDATVAQISGDTFATVQEFRNSVRQDIILEKELAKAQAVWLAVKRDASVRRFPEKELQATVAMYRQNYEDLAARFELSLEQLVTVYMESTMEAFEADARAYAEEKVKNDMIMIQLVRLQDITLTEEEYLAGAQEYFAKEEGDFGSFEEFVEYYTEENLRRSILWDKALKAVVDRAVPIG
ncbi:MAG: hypothetical protein IJC26_02425 [Clostridia bacterium]|nr:hypothetical protein [Clostridia bacterium]